MLYDTYIQIAGRRTREKHLIITGVINPDSETPSYEFTDLDTGECKDVSHAVLMDAVKDTVLRRYDCTLVSRKYSGVRWVEPDDYERIIEYIVEHGIFPHHLLKQNKAA